jgi:hypothetical protein
MLVKSIDTLPAFAVSEVVSYFSSPCVLAARESAEDAPPAVPELAAGVDAVVPPDSAAVLGGVEAVVPLEELPQPASATAPTVNIAAVDHNRGRRRDTPDLELKVCSSFVRGVRLDVS